MADSCPLLRPWHLWQPRIASSAPSQKHRLIFRTCKYRSCAYTHQASALSVYRHRSGLILVVEDGTRYTALSAERCWIITMFGNMPMKPLSPGKLSMIPWWDVFVFLTGLQLRIHVFARRSWRSSGLCVVSDGLWLRPGPRGRTRPAYCIVCAM